MTKNLGGFIGFTEIAGFYGNLKKAFEQIGVRQLCPFVKPYHAEVLTAISCVGKSPEKWGFCF